MIIQNKKANKKTLLQSPDSHSFLNQSANFFGAFLEHKILLVCLYHQSIKSLPEFHSSEFTKQNNLAFLTAPARSHSTLSWSNHHILVTSELPRELLKHYPIPPQSSDSMCVWTWESAFLTISQVMLMAKKHT